MPICGKASAERGGVGKGSPWCGRPEVSLGNAWDGSKVIWGMNSGGKTHAVDRTYNTHRSPYGAVDMAGNTWEWVSDRHKGDYYRNAPDRNPKGPSSGGARVVRGGSWGFSWRTSLRTTYRHSNAPDFWNIAVGFRCVKVLKE